MNSTLRAGSSLDDSARINNGKLAAVGRHLHFVNRNHAHNREKRALGFPAFGAAASMVVEYI